MMTATQRGYFRMAILFALLFDVVLMAGLLWWGGEPERTDLGDAIKTTVTVGIPTMMQLLKNTPLTVDQLETDAYGAIGIVLFVLFAAANAVYVALLARSVRNLQGPVTQGLLKSTFALIIWLVVQMVFGALLFPIAVMLEAPGFALTVVASLWFRFALFFIEFTIVVRKHGFMGAWVEALRMRKFASTPVLLLYFFGILAVNAAIAFALNGYYSNMVLAVLLPVNTIVMTMLQYRLMHHFFSAQDRLDEKYAEIEAEERNAK